MSESVPEEWAESSIEELLTADCLFSDGDWVESKDQDPNGTNRLIQLADIGDGNFRDRSHRFMNDEQFEKLNCTEIKQGDILIARMPDPIGRATIFPKIKSRSATVVDIAILRASKIDSYWLMSVINSSDFRKNIEENATGTTRIRIGRNSLSKIKFNCPPLPEQKKIASILTSVDEVIEKTQLQIDKLQDLKKGMMNELLTKGIGHTEFKDSELGRIPKSWECVKLGVITKVTDGAHKTPKYIDSGVPFLRVTDIQSSEINISKTKYISRNEHEELCKRCLPEKGDVLISKNGTIGITKIINWDWEFSIFVSLALLKIHNKDKVNVEFLDLYLQSPIVKKQIKDRAKQASVTNLHLEEIRDFDFVIPSTEEQKKIICIVSSIEKKIRTKVHKLFQIQSLKKSLMQDLLTGKVRVKVN